MGKIAMWTESAVADQEDVYVNGKKVKKQKLFACSEKLWQLDIGFFTTRAIGVLAQAACSEPGKDCETLFVLCDGSKLHGATEHEIQELVSRMASADCALATLDSPELCKMQSDGLVLTQMSGRCAGFPAWRRPLMMTMLMGVYDQGSVLSRLKGVTALIQKMAYYMSASTTIQDQVQEAVRVVGARGGR